MSSMTKSYWQRMSVRTDGDRQAVKSWFSPLCDDMTPESAEVLCDKQTDREKKARAMMVDADGVKHIATRTLGGKTFSIAIRRAAG